MMYSISQTSFLPSRGDKVPISIGIKTVSGTIPLGKYFMDDAGRIVVDYQLELKLEL